MKQATLSPLLLAGALCASNAFAQEAAAPPAEAEKTTEAAPATDAASADAAAAPAAQAETAAPVVQATASALSPAVQTVVGAPAAGKARVVFFRPSKFAGGAVKFKVREGETELGQLASGRWFVRDMEPGEHAFTVHSEAKDVTNAELEAGQTYFFNGSISMGVMVGHPNLSPSDAAAFEAALKKMKQI
jgi:hypothetical protein